VSSASLEISAYNVVKSGLSGCVLLNSTEQHILCSKKDEPQKEKFVYLNVENGFKLALYREEIEFIKKELPGVKYAVSAFLPLYAIFLEEKRENALWVLNQKEYLTVAVFKEGSVLFFRHIFKEKNFAFSKIVIDSIKEFYKSECCYFLEEIILYDCDDLEEESIRLLQEQSLLQVESRSCDLKELLNRICEDEKLKEFLLPIESKRFFLPSWIKWAAAVIFVLLVAVDVWFKYKQSQLNEILAELQRVKESLQSETGGLEETISSLKRIEPMVQKIDGENSLKIANIKNVFDLVPQTVVLKSAVFGGDYLVLEGFSDDRAGVFRLKRSLQSFYPLQRVTINKRKGRYIFKIFNKEQK